jgi:uridine kinase
LAAAPTGVTTRAEVVGAVVDVVLKADPGHPTRVAVEGITGAGKTTFARELAEAVAATGRPARALTMDGWHHPRQHRRRQGRLSADGYYEDAYDHVAFRDEVLVPLGGETPHAFRPAIIDLATDQAVHPELVAVAPDEVVLVDGSFLGKPLLHDHWDLRIWLDVPFEVAQARGVSRDAELLGGTDAAAEAFEQRYHAAFRRYLSECDPLAAADVLIEHSDPTDPRLLRP